MCTVIVHHLLDRWYPFGGLLDFLPLLDGLLEEGTSNDRGPLMESIIPVIDLIVTRKEK